MGSYSYFVAHTL